MNIIYKITFQHRLAQNIQPYYYIGSKTNCTVVEGVILNSKGKPYYGSSTWKNYYDIVESDTCTVEILQEGFTDHKELLTAECAVQEELEVVVSPEYFNRSLASVSNFNNPLYASYKHATTGKMVRLERTHEKVLDGTYVGVSKGVKFTEEQRNSRGRSGKENKFYGKTHTDETKAKISAANTGKVRTEEFKQAVSDRCKGVPKSPEHRAKIGRPGLIMLKNINTLQTIRISIDDALLLDNTTWLNPQKVNTKVKKPCKYCGRLFTKGNMNRWHGEKCKSKSLHPDDSLL